ncbi:reprolysin-like metallopeptidase [Flavobacterium lindanitolerans]|uniref:Secreted protein (Por secretion system target) n=1 Tax=Flavobacterium lindanitolerans TaxID=428988 RepID=A0A497V0U4_9FLAO|nr:zinc-dependent metalloprotease family protein [Flavobacterium lindanitolerans]PKW28698.1 putative secreted protein (Por secretion system target) [Flavobacterium lindanitolerans]RLJ35797.1 putative secreted protein (Por secretion system target) [Flavobacterium lindanitolerans]
MKKLLPLIVFVLMFSAGYSQSLPIWTKTTAEKLSVLEKADRSSMPQKFQIFHLDFSGLKSQLQMAPSREAGEVSNVIIAFPNAEGKLENYRIYESSVMAPELAKAHPEIQSYIGQGIDDPTARIHLTTTIFGLHTMTLSGRGTFYIDPYTKDVKNYIVYDKSDLTTSRNFECKVQENTVESMDVPLPPPASDGRFRTYRLAMACTVEYATFHVNAAVTAGTLSPTATLAQKKAAVLAAMNVTVARVNSVYERDMSLRMQLVANNESVIFVDADNFTNDDAEALIDESQVVIDNAIGNTNYDIGHTVSTGGGGLAQSPAVCISSGKAKGITGSDAPVGDPYDIDYVAHEMGHQFGAAHTFNNSCGNNRQTGSAVEPGSGSTIMGYAGICSPNVQNGSDAYFHAVSIAQMVSHITGNFGNCVPGVANGNTPPTVPALTSYTIPAGTPFVLRGSATDVNGDALTYCWEQTNSGVNTNLPSATSTTSNPNFRSVAPSSSPNRYFPSLANIVSGGTSPWEVIPTVARTLNFALTVRDNRSPNGGQTTRQNMTVTTSTAAGPFTVTSQNTDGITWTQGQTQTVTWNVANTTAAPFNTANVNILLSTDGGLTYPTVLVANTPNDGSQTITVPNTAAPFCRIMVESVGNIFYAINSKTFAIGYTVTNTCNTYTTNTAFAIPDNNQNFTVRATSIPTTANISDVNVAVNISHTYLADLQVVLVNPAQTLVPLFLNACDGVTTSLNATFDDQGTNVTCGAVITGNILPAEPLSIYNGTNPQGNWLFAVRDLAAQDTGTVNSFSITICSQTAVLSTENFGLADFKIYPNPNNGTFNIQFNSDSSNEIKVGVHDIRGREIFNQSYQNTGLFSQSLQLSNAQSGIYLVTVQDGDKKEVKKIVIQ